MEGTHRLEIVWEHVGDYFQKLRPCEMSLHMQCEVCKKQMEVKINVPKCEIRGKKECICGASFEGLRVRKAEESETHAGILSVPNNLTITKNVICDEDVIWDPVVVEAGKHQQALLFSTKNGGWCKSAGGICYEKTMVFVPGKNNRVEVGEGSQKRKIRPKKGVLVKTYFDSQANIEFFGRMAEVEEKHLREREALEARLAANPEPPLEVADVEEEEEDEEEGSDVSGGVFGMLPGTGNKNEPEKDDTSLEDDYTDPYNLGENEDDVAHQNRVEEEAFQEFARSAYGIGDEYGGTDDDVPVGDVAGVHADKEDVHDGSDMLNRMVAAGLDVDNKTKNVKKEVVVKTKAADEVVGLALSIVPL